MSDKKISEDTSQPVPQLGNGYKSRPSLAEEAQPKRQICQAGKDGDCDWDKCPQKVEYKTWCPLAIDDEEEAAPQKLFLLDELVRLEKAIQSARSEPTDLLLRRDKVMVKLSALTVPQKCPDVCPRCGSDDRTKYVLRSGAWSSCYESTHHSWHDAKPAESANHPGLSSAIVQALLGHGYLTVKQDLFDAGLVVASELLRAAESEKEK